MNTLPFAPQLYSVRDHMERDSRKRFAVKKAGFDRRTRGGPRGWLDAFAELLADVGLVAVSAHFLRRLPRGLRCGSGLQPWAHEAVIPWLDPSDDRTLARTRRHTQRFRRPLSRRASARLPQPTMS